MTQATSPADQMAALFEASGIDNTGWTIKVGQLTSEPDKIVCFYDTGGRPPNPRWKLDYLTFMVQVRCAPDDYATGWTKGREVRDFFLGIEPQTLTSGDRIDGIIMPGEMAYIGPDDQKRCMFSINFQIFWEPADSNLTTREPL